MATWKTFFKDAGIAEPHRDNYATTFADNEMDTSTATELTREILAELGITIIGHVLLILKYSRKGDTKPSIAKPSVKPSLKPPQLASDLTRPQFRKFKVDWGVYKSISGIEEGHIAAQIYSICDANVQNSIINTHPDFFKESESEIMNMLEKLVTKSANPTVHRMAFYGITQAENESMSNYLVRLNASAQDCEYTCPKCRHDLSPCHVRDQFIKGLSNANLQTDILAKSSELPEIEDVVKHAQAHEAAIQDQLSLQESTINPEVAAFQGRYRGGTQPADGRNNQRDNDGRGIRRNNDDGRYRRDNDGRGRGRGNPAATSDNHMATGQGCNGCGSARHGDSDRMTRCPAWGQTCRNCNGRNHYSRACRR